MPGSAGHIRRAGATSPPRGMIGVEQRPPGGRIAMASEVTSGPELLPGSRTERGGLAHEPGLDGLRGVAVAGVLLFHGGAAWMSGGFLGVSTFFTLSGFLITRLLLFERDRTGRIDLRHFWSRRMRRLFPAALLALVLAVVYVAVVGERAQYDRLRLDVGAALGYSENWRLILGGHSYADLFSSPSPVQHFWSLAVEEQFYFVFPIVAAFLLGRGHGTRRWFTAGLVTMCAVSVALLFVLYRPGEDPSRVYYGSDTRAFELLVGGLLAVILTGGAGARLGRSVRLQRVVGALGVIALVATIVAWAIANDSDAWLYRGGLALYAIGSCCVILAAVVPGPVRALLSVAPLRALGRISYGVYLYHWPVFLWLTPVRTGLDGVALFALRSAATVGLAVLSFHFVKQPIRERRRITRRGSWVVAPVAALALCGMVGALTVDPPPSRIVFRAASDTGARPPTPTLTPTRAPESSPTDGATIVAGATLEQPVPAPTPVSRVMMVGDSVAQTLGRGLERWGPPHGVTVWNVARYYCGVLHTGSVKIGTTQQLCDQWDSWRQQVAEFRPEVVVVLSTVWDIVERQWQPGAEFVAPGDPAFDDRFVDEYTQAVDLLSAGGARVVVVEPICTANTAHSERLRLVRQQLLPRLKWARPTQVRLVDITHRICPEGAFTTGLGGIADARPDGVHFTDPAADWIATWLMPTVVDPTPAGARSSIPIAWLGGR